jgi:GrpB-like predicted nucleotidyltransferase (UPF0157 family)
MIHTGAPATGYPIVVGQPSNRPGPIQLVEYDPRWVDVFEQEQALIAAALGAVARDIQHIGSTSVPGLAAKPYVDIAVKVSPLLPAGAYAHALETVGYTYGISEEDDVRIVFWKTTPHDVNLHIVEYGGWADHRHVLFRDWLREHPDACRAYADLKRSNAEAHATEIDAYTNAKSEFVEDIIRAAAERAGIPYGSGNQPPGWR